MDDPFSLYKNLKKARITKGISQKDLAKKLNLSDRAISAYETGRAIPPSSTLAKMAEILDVSVSEIIGGEEERLVDKLNSHERRIAALEQVIMNLLAEKKK